MKKIIEKKMVKNQNFKKENSNSIIQKISSLFQSSDLKYILVVIFLATIAGAWLLLPGYYNMHDDLQMTRQLVMETCFKDGQLPCRWTQYMGYGFGFPLFNYYPPLPYIFGEIYRILGFSFVDTAKLTFFASFVFSGITMYFLGREFWGRLGGLISAAFYIWAPYHSLDIYVRGAMNEAWALIWFPIILLSAYKLIEVGKFKYIVILALSFFGLFTSHNLMVLIFSPLFAIWCLVWIFKNRKWNAIPSLAISGIWSFGLASFFTIPVILEQKFVQVSSLVVGYYDYIVHFASVKQLLFDRFWGYGASVWMEEDRMSFQVGHLHWILSIIILIYFLLRFYKKKKLDTQAIVSIFFVLSGWFAILMTHNQSTPIWLTLNNFIKFVQFPWRFLTLTILSLSIAIGSIAILFPEKYKLTKYIVVGIIIFGLVIFNINFFAPEYMKMGPLTDEQKFTKKAWDLQQTSGIYDYLPVGAKTAPKAPQKVLAEVVEGNAELSNLSQQSNKGHANANVISDKAVLQINIFQYPGWEVYVNGVKVDTFVGKDEWGRIHINLEKGLHEIEVVFKDTLVRTISNSISLFSWIVLITIPFWKRKFGLN